MSFFTTFYFNIIFSQPYLYTLVLFSLYLNFFYFCSHFVYKFTSVPYTKLSFAVKRVYVGINLFVRFLYELSLIYDSLFIGYNQEGTETRTENVNQCLVDHLMDRFSSAR